ncbi:MAG: hypothetical protein V7K41_13020 [Nostoc sp.]|uniref:hypothetical protein n=1 Tax=Nostoc sp. TaxID=1180 RepID=UPI002FFBC477
MLSAIITSLLSTHYSALSTVSVIFNEEEIGSTSTYIINAQPGVFLPNMLIDKFFMTLNLDLCKK